MSNPDTTIRLNYPLEFDCDDYQEAATEALYWQGNGFAAVAVAKTEWHKGVEIAVWKCVVTGRENV